MSDEIESETPEELRRAQRRQIRAIGATALSVVAVVAATAIGVHAWHRAPHAGLTSANVAASSQPLTSVPATSEPPASASEVASDPPPIDSPSSQSTSTPSPSARSTPSTIDSKVNGEVDLKLTMTASPTRVVFGQPVHVTVTIVNTGRVYARTTRLGVGTMRPTDTFEVVSGTCDAPQPGGVWCSAGALEPGQKKTFSFSITPESAPFPNDLVYADIEYLDSHGQQDDEQVTAPELTVIDDPGNVPATSPPTSTSPATSTPPSSTPAPTASSTTAGSASPSITPSAS